MSGITRVVRALLLRPNMRTIGALKLVGGSIVVYCIVAACSGPSGPATSASGSIARRLDALTEPVPEAMARGGVGVAVATEKCDKTFTLNGTSYSYYAMHAYPGMTIADLAPIAAVVHYNTVPVGLGPPGYADQQTTAVLREGYAAVLCANDPITAQNMTVTFMLH